MRVCSPAQLGRDWRLSQLTFFSNLFEDFCFVFLGVSSGDAKLAANEVYYNVKPYKYRLDHVHNYQKRWYRNVQKEDFEIIVCLHMKMLTCKVEGIPNCSSLV